MFADPSPTESTAKRPRPARSHRRALRLGLGLLGSAAAHGALLLGLGLLGAGHLPIRTAREALAVTLWDAPLPSPSAPPPVARPSAPTPPAAPQSAARRALEHRSPGPVAPLPAAPQSAPVAEAPPSGPTSGATPGPGTATSGAPAPTVAAAPGTAPAAVESGAPAGPPPGYSEAVRTRLVRERHYPPLALRMHREGTVLLRLHIAPDGRLSGEPQVLHSAGHDVLDREALRMAEAAAPYPLLPAGSQPLTLNVPIEFALVSTLSPE